MFVRPSWIPHSKEDIYRIVKENPWGLLISNGERGPRVTNLPFVLDATRGDEGVLVSHIARANEHSAALLDEKSPVLAVFHGPSSYVTPSWYPGRDMPPTIYYTAVHCYGTLAFQDNPELLESLEKLVSRNETKVPDGWQLTEVPREAILRRLSSILGFELRIERIEAKFKLGQDEPKRDALAVAERLLHSENATDRALGAMVYRYNEARDN